jgi:hypothetical protein
MFGSAHRWAASQLGTFQDFADVEVRHSTAGSKRAVCLAVEAEK